MEKQLKPTSTTKFEDLERLWKDHTTMAAPSRHHTRLVIESKVTSFSFDCNRIDGELHEVALINGCIMLSNSFGSNHDD